MPEEGVMQPRVGVAVFVFRDGKFIDQKWVDFESLPEPLFLPWQELLRSEFLSGMKVQLARTIE